MKNIGADGINLLTGLASCGPVPNGPWSGSGPWTTTVLLTVFIIIIIFHIIMYFVIFMNDG